MAGSCEHCLGGALQDVAVADGSPIRDAAMPVFSPNVFGNSSKVKISNGDRIGIGVGQ